MSWADDKMQELMEKPREAWDEDDYDTYHYIEQLRFERGYYDSSDSD